MLNLLRKSLSIEIDNFLNFIKDKLIVSEDVSYTKSAFVQSRKKINSEVFKHLSQTLINEFYTDNDEAIKLFKGFRILAVDGSRITLPLTKDLQKKYGSTKNQTNTSIVQAKCSILYDIENKYVLDGTLSAVNKGERELAIEHLKYCKSGDLLIYDRGYPSFGFIYKHNELNLNYLMRVKIKFSKITIDFEASGKTSQVVELKLGNNTKTLEKEELIDKTVKARLIRVNLPNGHTEILITSLLDSQKYPSSMFMELYGKRWGIETFYDELKNKLKIEHFSGYSNQSIMQDFEIALFISNIQTLITNELENEIEQKSTKYKYKVNTNLSYGFLKNRIIEILFSEDVTEDLISELKTLYAKHLVPIRPNRSFDRNTKKYTKRIKPKIVKNQKDAF